MSDYKLTVGLEIHAELATKTKMFCDSKNDTDEKRPNVNICPICMGHPGTLPVINKEAVAHVLRLGTAVGGTLASTTLFDRKNYFYPDIPKGYQISQYKHPLVEGGELAGVKITRIHLEEDTARSQHPSPKLGEGLGVRSDDSLVDFNRAGIPLMEMVTEPVIHSPEEASAFARELQLLLRCLGAGEANMEKGEMRVEANVSVSPISPFNPFSKKLGTKVEVKNLNSFRSVERAIAYERDRQIKALENGERVAQETRGWDEVKEVTFPQRAKEESHDYRYFPDPDLPKLYIEEVPEWSEEALKASLPELPWQKRERFIKDFGLNPEEAEVYTRELELSKFLEAVASILRDKDSIKLASNYILSDLKSKVPEEGFAEIIKMLREEAISSRAAKDILKMLESNNSIEPRAFAKEKGLTQISDPEELKKIAVKIMKANPDITDENFLVGQAMKEMRGSGNPALLKEIFTKLLK